MGYIHFIARRLTLGSAGRKATPAVTVAVIAVALSTAVMMASVAVVKGFKREIRDKVTGFNGHITIAGISSANGDNLVSLSPTLRGILDSQPYISSYAAETAMPAIIKTDDDFKGVYAKNIAGSGELEFLRRNLEEGAIPDLDTPRGEVMTVISRIAADKLNLKTGQKIDVYFMSDDVRVRRLTIAGIYNSHFDSYDDFYAYVSMPLLRQLAHMKPDQGTALRVRVSDFDRLADNTLTLHRRLASATADGEIFRHYTVDTVLRQGANYFQWLSLLDTNVAVILALMTAVACVTLISGMLIMITDKMRFIGLMKTMGASNSSLRRIFISLALRVAVTGMLIGDAMMLGILWAQHTTHFIPLDPESYYIGFVPVEFDWWGFLLLNAGVATVIYLALVIPSRYLSGIRPSQTIRYE